MAEGLPASRLVNAPCDRPSEARGPHRRPPRLPECHADLSHPRPI